jgi:DNA-binding SARP family transcriptional activator
MLHAKLLASAQLSLNGTSLSSLLSGRGLAFFAYVAANNTSCPRIKFHELLWADVTEKQAQENVRVLIYNVRQILGDYMSVTRTTVELNRRLPYWSDLDAFSSIADERVACDPSLLTQILKLYECDFLDGFSISNAPGFESWLTQKRRHFHNLAILGWQRLAELHGAEQRYEEGITANEHLLTLAPWHEEAHQRHMRFLMALGRRSAALAQYEICCQQLSDELDVSPSAETRSLYEQIRSVTHVEKSTSPSIQPIPKAPTVENLVSIALGTMPTQKWLLGRQQELKTLHQWTVLERCRSVAILGIGGQGKTALAAYFVQTLAEVSSNAEPAFDGIIWHSLRNMPRLEDVLQEWIFRLSDQQIFSLPPTLDGQIDLLVSYIKAKRFLFVLDDVEAVMSPLSGEQEELYSTYAQLWRSFIERDHQSCLLVVGREWITHLQNHYERSALYRRLILDGLGLENGRQIVTHHGFEVSHAEYAKMHQIYAGNPLMLELAGQTIDELFFGDVQAFLSEGSPFLGEIGATLDQQFSGLTRLEQEMLTWLALEDRPVSLHHLWDNLLIHPTKRDYFAALNTLLRRSLIRQNGVQFDVPNLIVQYARQRLLDELYLEFIKVSVYITEPSAIRVTAMQLNRYPLCKLQAQNGFPVADRPFLLLFVQRLHRFGGGEQGFRKLIQFMLSALNEEVEVVALLTTGYAKVNLQFLYDWDPVSFGRCEAITGEQLV